MDGDDDGDDDERRKKDGKRATEPGRVRTDGIRLMSRQMPQCVPGVGSQLAQNSGGSASRCSDTKTGHETKADLEAGGFSTGYAQRWIGTGADRKERPITLNNF